VSKKRLDLLLLEKSLFASRAKAQAAILAGQVWVNGQKCEKAGIAVAEDAQIEIRGEKLKYVSRGGIKLEKALKEFKINPAGRVCLDIGASTGGFCDCLLQNGAALVFAVDVGQGQLAWQLQKDPRVIRVDKTNARYLTAETLRQAAAKHGQTTGVKIPIPEPSLCTIDVSFISLSKIFPAVFGLLASSAAVVALIKPQFEAGKDRVEKGGLVKDPKVHQDVIKSVTAAAEKNNFKVKAVTESPITGADGNIEFLMYLTK
jgi:23S rRNA (cytidine1920-2'-O)/16S rRNA (cytidine1409-2'-O)-methyltransferase